MSATTTFAHLEYASLLQLMVEHGYYAQSYCPQLRLEPSAETAQKLRGWRLLFKPSPKGGNLVGPVPSPVELPTAAAPEALDFFLMLQSPEVLAVTAWEQGGQGLYAYEFVGGSWTPESGHRQPMAAPPGAVARLRLHFAYTAGQMQYMVLQLGAPEVVWKYYFVTGPNYVANLQIAENGQVVSSVQPDDPNELAIIQGRYPGKKIITVSVRLLLKRDLPPWYLVVEGVHVGANHVPDVPPLPKPRPGAAPHLILDYSAILK